MKILFSIPLLLLTTCINLYAQVQPGPTISILYTTLNPSGNACIVGTSVGFVRVSTSVLYLCQGATIGAAGTYAASGGSGGSSVRSCQAGLGDGLNAMSAGTYLQSTCYNDSGGTLTITGIKCFTDNSGTSTMSVTNGAGTALLTGAITCTTAFAAGTQGATTTIASGDFMKFTFIADGTSKQTTWVVSQ